jgi:hypothetical protein
VIARTAACIAIALVGLALVGRWEHRRASAHQRSLMAQTYRLATSQGLRSPLITAYRLAPTFDCLLYRAPGIGAFAFELCFDRDGRLVETIDRRTADVRIASVRHEPSQAGIRIDPRLLLRAFRQVGMAKDPRVAGLSSKATQLPVGFDDSGPMHG